MFCRGVFIAQVKKLPHGFVPFDSDEFGEKMKCWSVARSTARNGLGQVRFTHSQSVWHSSVGERSERYSFKRGRIYALRVK